MTKFEVDLTEKTDEIFDLMTRQEQELVLKHFIRKEVDKKVFEINKNYRDLSRFDADKFNDILFDRLMKKVVLQESGTESKPKKNGNGKKAKNNAPEEVTEEIAEDPYEEASSD